MEVGQTVLSLDLVDAEADLAERVVLILLEIGQGDLDDASLEGIVGVLQTGGAVDEGLADTAKTLLAFFDSSGCVSPSTPRVQSIRVSEAGGRLTLGR